MKAGLSDDSRVGSVTKNASESTNMARGTVIGSNSWINSFPSAHQRLTANNDGLARETHLHHTGFMSAQ
jgi:hypothetical protein